MSDLRRAVARLLAAFRPARAEADLTREIDAHLALLEDDFRRQGLTADRARLAARRALGGVALAKELHRDARSFPWIDDLRRDLLYAGRTLRRTPGFAIVAILTIALGVGANTAIFSVVHAVVLNPLPFADADRLVRLFENVPAAESRDGRPRRVGGMDVRELIELKARSRALSHVAGQGIALVSITGGVDVVQREVTSMSADAFPMLGIQPLLGRWFTREDERAGREKVIVLSHGAWQRYFAGDREALGRTIAFNGNTFSQGIALGEQYMVVGVMPPDFHFPDDNTEFWVPLVLAPPPDGRARRSTMTARLADGASPEAAAAEVEGIVRAVRGVAALPADGSQPRFEFVRVRDQFAASVRPALLVLMVAVAFVLLIACANIANLLLARAAYRQREMAVRAAIGAGRGRLVRQLLTESVVIALTGGGAGVVLAVGGVALFRHVATDLARIDLGSLDTAFPRLDAISINGPVLLFAVAISLATGLVFGLLPAIRSAQGGHAEALRGAGGAAFHAGAHGRSKTHDVLVMTEIALAMILLVGGALLIHSFVKLTKVELGYDPSNVLTFQASLPGIQRPPAELKAFAEDLVASLQKLPDVEAAGYANQLPLVALENSLALSTTPFPSAPQAAPPVDSPDARLVSRDFLETLGIRILAGRGFDEGDRAGQPRVLLVNQTLARREFGDRNPVGSTVYVWRDPMPWQVIGVVDDVRQAGLDREPRPQLFIDLRQWTRRQCRSSRQGRITPSAPARTPRR